MRMQWIPGCFSPPKRPGYEARREDTRSNGARARHTAATVCDALPAAHAELAANGAVQCTPTRAPRSNALVTGHNSVDALVTGHNSVDSRDVELKNLRIYLSLLGYRVSYLLSDAMKYRTRL